MTKDKTIKTVKPEIPSGFLDFGPREYLAREMMLKTIESVFRSFGYDPIETPMVEFLQTLTGEDETSKNIFTINSKVGRDKDQLALRFDQTVPFARFLSANPYDPTTKTGVKLPFRRMVIGPVFRGETPQKGRYRQFYQADVDIAGASSMLADSEIVAIIYRTLTSLEIERFVIRLNNRKILNALSELVGIKDRGDVSVDDMTKEMMRILDKIDKIGIEGVEFELKAIPDNEFSRQPNLSDEAFLKVKEYLDITGDNKTKLEKCKKIFSGISIAEEGIKELEEILGYAKAYGIPENFITIDFSISRGLDYYTGPVMETVLLDLPNFGSMFSGGRYNDLVKRFTGKELPVVGASIGVDRLFAALKELNAVDSSKMSNSQVVVLRLSDKYDEEYIKITEEVRNLGYKVEMCLLEDTTFQSQFNFALNRLVKYMIICGEEEVAKGTLQIKNTETREQVEIKRDGLKEYFKK